MDLYSAESLLVTLPVVEIILNVLVGSTLTVTMANIVLVFYLVMTLLLVVRITIAELLYLMHLRVLHLAHLGQVEIVPSISNVSVHPLAIWKKTHQMMTTRLTLLIVTIFVGRLIKRRCSADQRHVRAEPIASVLWGKAVLRLTENAPLTMMMMVITIAVKHSKTRQHAKIQNAQVEPMASAR